MSVDLVFFSPVDATPGPVDLVFGDSAPASTSAVLKAWNGAAWVAGVAKRYNGAAFVAAAMKVRSGGEWVTT